MGLFKKIVFFSLFLSFAGMACAEESKPSHILYLMQIGEVERALQSYQLLAKTKGQDFALLQKLALLLLQKGAESNDPTIEQLTIFGAGLAASSHSLPILEKGLMSKNIQTSLMALHFLSLFQDDRSDELIEKILASDFLMARLEALYVMAQKKHPHAIGQIESLMHRLPPEAKSIFPALFALVGTPNATPFLKEMLSDSDPYVRMEALLCVGRFDRDDLLSYVRQKAAHPSIMEKEAFCSVLGTLKDSSSIPLLKKLAKNSADNVQVAAHAALFLLGEDESKVFLLEQAKNKNLFALSFLSFVPKCEELLLELCHDASLDVRLNATFALLKKRDERVLESLKEILLLDKKNHLLMPLYSPGRSMQAWHVLVPPSFFPKNEGEAMMWEVSLSIKELFLKMALDLPEKAFLSLAASLFDRQVNELIPTLVHALENLHTEGAIALLKSQTQKTGAPLIRDYTNLALFRMKEEGPYEQHVYDWISREGGQELIHLRPYLPWKNRIQSFYSLSPEETSLLLIETYAALAESRREMSISLLVDALLNGNKKNRYTLLGLLLRATE